jgi:hypothetical protein
MLYPLMLLGLAGLLGPVLIHLIHRQKLQPRFLATLRFLDEGDASNAFEPVPRDLLQLLLRLLMLLILVLLMVRFTSSSSQTGPRALTIILDHTMSMQRELADGDTLFERQKAEIADLVAGMNEEDRFSLMLVGDSIAAETGFLSDKEKLLAALEGFSAGDGGGRALVPAIRAALRRLQSRKELNTGVLVFSDHQQTNYASIADDNALKPILEDGRVKLFLISPPLDDTTNIAVEDSGFTPQRVYVGTSSKMTATVRNLTDEEQSVEISFQEGRATGENRPLALAPREAARIDLAHTFESPDDAPCSVAISEDVLQADNVFRAPMRMRHRRRVLLIAPPTDETESGVRASYVGEDLLTYAINPGERLGLGTGTHINVERKTPNLLARVSLPLYSTIIIYGLSGLPDEQSVEDLGAYVKNGGTLCLIPRSADSFSPGRFNDSFAPLLGGFRLGGLKEPAEATFIDKNEASVTHPMLLPMMRGEWGDVDDISFTRYFGAVGIGKAARALRGSNGDVLAAVVHLGRGDVYVQTFGCEIEDSSLPRSTAFVPLAQTISAELGAQAEPVDADIMRVNEIARMRLPEMRTLSGNVELRRFRAAGPEAEDEQPPEDAPPDHELELLSAAPGVVKVEDVRRAGNYRVSHPGQQTRRPRWLAVNAVKGESDLRTIEPEEQDSLFGGVNVARLDFDDLAAAFARRSEIFPLMIALLFIAFIVEAVAGAAQSLRKGGTNE